MAVCIERVMRRGSHMRSTSPSTCTSTHVISRCVAPSSRYAYASSAAASSTGFSVTVLIRAASARYFTEK